MARPKILALILAGGAGSRMEVLTDVRAKPAMPFAGAYRLIDFPLSNCVHSGISDVWVIEQFKPKALNDHLANGRPWDLDRTYGGLRILQPHQGMNESGWHHGNADAIYRNISFLREFAPDILLVLSSDHIYKLDFSKVIDEHIARDADVTMVTTEVGQENAGRFGTVQVDDEGKVTDFEYKPDAPRSGRVTTEIFVYNAPRLLATLEELAGQSDGEDDAPALKDFGHELLPHMVQEGKAYEYRLEGYWQDVGTIESYWQSHMDLLQAEPPLNLDDPAWPILTFGAQRMPARIDAPAQVENSLISPGCHVRGRVIRSVLAAGVVVEEGALVRDSIVLHDTMIGRGATVIRAIVDQDVRIGEKASIGEGPIADRAEGKEKGTLEITLVGQQARVGPGARVAQGEQVEPASRSTTPGHR